MADWSAFPVVQQGGNDPWAAFPRADERTFGQEVDRKAALGTQGVRTSLLDAAGAPVDLVAAGLQKIGIGDGNAIGGSKSLNAAADWVASLPGRIAPELFSKGERLTPETTTEKAIQGAGQGVGTALGMMIPAAGVANTARAGTVTQGVAQTLAAQPAMQMASGAAAGATQAATDNPWLGLAAGLAVPVAAGVGSRVVTPMGPARTAAEEERRRLVDVLRQQNVPLTTGEITGNKGVQVLESVLETLPLSGPMQRGFNDRQREAANRLVTSFTGEGVPAFTNAEREGRRAALGQQFENLARNTTVNLDTQFGTQIDDVLTRYRQQLPPDVYRNVEQRLNALLDAATTPGNPQIPGEIYQRIRSSLSQQATDSGNREASRALREMRNALDAAARRSLPPDVAAEWDQVRRQWGNLRTIENSMRNTDAAVGDIAPRALGQAVDTANRRGGSREMQDVAAALRKVLGDKMGQSGTQPRSTWGQIATGGAVAGTGFGLAGPAGVGAALASPAVIQVLLENPATRAWASNRLLQNVATLPSRELVGNVGLARALANVNESNAAQRRGGAR